MTGPTPVPAPLRPAGPPPSVTLEPGDYWKLRALDSDLNLAQQQLQVMADRRKAVWAEIVAKYALDPSTNYRASDADCSLSDAAAPPG